MFMITWLYLRKPSRWNLPIAKKTKFETLNLKISTKTKCKSRDIKETKQKEWETKMEGKTLSDKSHSLRRQVLACFLHPWASQLPFKSLELRQQSKSKNVEEQNQRASKLFKTQSPSYCSLATQWKTRSINFKQRNSKSSTTQLWFTKDWKSNAMSTNACWRRHGGVEKQEPT